MASTMEGEETSGKKYLEAETNWLNGLGQVFNHSQPFFLICKMGLIILIL